jgi:hypothetical protein
MAKTQRRKTQKQVRDAKIVCLGFIHHALPRKTYMPSNILFLFALKEVI